MVERRKMARLSWKGKIKIVDPITGRTLTEDARLRNVGKNGFAFLAECKILRGVNYQFKIDLNGAPVEVSGKVVHLKLDSIHYIGGVNIESINFSSRRKLNRFLCTQSDKMQRTFLIRSLIGGLLVAAFFKVFVGTTLMKAVIGFLISSVVLFVLLPF